VPPQVRSHPPPPTSQSARLISTAIANNPLATIFEEADDDDELGLIGVSAEILSAGGGRSDDGEPVWGYEGDDVFTVNPTGPRYTSSRYTTPIEDIEGNRNTAPPPLRHAVVDIRATTPHGEGEDHGTDEIDDDASYEWDYEYV
jgi:hypothetical protein